MPVLHQGNGTGICQHGNAAARFLFTHGTLKNLEDGQAPIAAPVIARDVVGFVRTLDGGALRQDLVTAIHHPIERLARVEYRQFRQIAIYRALADTQRLLVVALG